MNLHYYLEDTLLRIILIYNGNNMKISTPNPDNMMKMLVSTIGLILIINQRIAPASQNLHFNPDKLFIDRIGPNADARDYSILSTFKL